MSYEYDVFLSYPRDPDLEAWIDAYFIPRLHSALREETLATCQLRMGKIFFDASGTEEALRQSRGFVRGIEPGALWQQELERVIGVSRCMVALWSNTYFDSQWCHSELGRFRVRQPQAKAPIITPVSIVRRDRLPQEYLDAFQVFDMHRYVIDGPSFYRSDEFPKFLAEIRHLAGSIARSICGAPDFQALGAAAPVVPVAPPPPAPPVAVGRF